jgi:hypothetical protein
MSTVVGTPTMTIGGNRAVFRRFELDVLRSTRGADI